MNDGKCVNGVCECRQGFKGITCSDGIFKYCSQIFSFLNSIFIGKYFDVEQSLLKVTVELENLHSLFMKMKNVIEVQQNNLKKETALSLQEIKKETKELKFSKII